MAMSPARALDLLTTPALPTTNATRALLLALASPAPGHWIAAGERGLVILSDDDGAHWRQAQVPVAVTLTALCFPTPQVGYACGHDGVVLRTEDAGATWRRVFDGGQANALVLAAARVRLAEARASQDASALREAESGIEDAQAAAQAGPSRPLLSLAFADESHGWVVGAYGQAFVTQDGGAHWERPAVPPPNPDGLHLNHVALAPAGATVLLAGEGGHVWRGTSGGTRWERLDTGYKGQLYGVAALDDAEAGGLLAWGFGGHVFRREAGDKAWTAIATTTRKSLVAAAHLRDGALALASQDGGVEISHDAGRSWTYVPGERPLPLAALAQGRDGRVLGAGWGGVRPLALTREGTRG